MKDQEFQGEEEQTPSANELGSQSQSVESAHTPTPWVVQRLNHIAGDLWLQIGLTTGFGPIAGITGDDTAEPTFKPVAGMKYLVTPEAEQWANAKFICKAVNSHEALVAALEDLYNMVNYALDARDALLISKTCATMDKVRAALALVSIGR